MINISELMRLVGNYDSINESFIMIPGKGKSTKTFKIDVRSRSGGGGRAGNVSQHSCSIKVKVDGTSTGIPLIIPPIPYDTLDEKGIEKVQGSIDTMYRKLKQSESKIGDACLQFAYDNQAAIVALWSINDETSPEGIALKDYMKERVSEVDYFSAKRKSWKSEEEYNADVAKINTYVKDHIKKMKESK